MSEITTAPTRAYYPALDGLRALAFLAVFFTHYNALPWGWTGVNLFFVLSGFLITGILFDTRDQPHRARNFYVRRTLRIFPLYYGVMLVVLAAWPIFHWQMDWRWLIWPAYMGNLLFVIPLVKGSGIQHLAYFQPFGKAAGLPFALFLGHFWTLCVEEQFYLFWPWVVFAVRSRRALLWICATAVPLCLFARIAAVHWMPFELVRQGVITHLTPFQLDSLLLGGLLALLLRGSHAPLLLRFARLALLPAALAITGAAWWISTVSSVFARSFHVYVDTWGLTALNLFFALLILVALQPATWLARAMSLRPLRWLGRISYGAYVLHDIPHVIYYHFALRLSPHHATIRTSVGGLTVTIALAALSFRFYETPFLKLKDRLTRRVTPASPVVPVPTLNHSQHPARNSAN